MADHPPLTQKEIDEFVGVSHGDLARVRALLAARPDLLEARAGWDETALGAASHAGSAEVARFLVAAGAPLNICTAAMLGLVDRVAAFLNADPAQANAAGAHGISALYHAVIRGQKAVADLLVAHGANVNAGEGGNTALHGTALFGQTEMAEWLLAQGANVNALDYQGKTPLRVATEAGHQATADLLRRHGGAD